MLKFVFGKLWNGVEELDFVQPQVELPYTYGIVTLGQKSVGVIIQEAI